MPQLERLLLGLCIGLFSLALIACGATTSSTVVPEVPGSAEPSATNSDTPTMPKTDSSQAADGTRDVPASGPTPSPSPLPSAIAPEARIETGQTKVEELPWVLDGWDSGAEIHTYDNLIFLRDEYPEVYTALTGLDWIQGPILHHYFTTIRALAEALPPGEIPALAQVLEESVWLQDGINKEERNYLLDLLLDISGPTATATLEELRTRMLTSLVPTPTPTPDLAGIMPVGELDLPWVQDGLYLGEEIETHANLIFLRDDFPEVYSAIISMPWIHEQVYFPHFWAVSVLKDISQMLRPEEIAQYSQVLLNAAWLHDGITDQESLYLVDIVTSGTPATVMVEEIKSGPAGSEDTRLEGMAGMFPWAQGDSLTVDEQSALDALTLMSHYSPSVFSVLYDRAWWLFEAELPARAVGVLLALTEIVQRFPQADVLVAQGLMEANWLWDGVDQVDVDFLESQTIRSASDASEIAEALTRPAQVETATPNRPALGPLVAIGDLSWTKDSLTELEQQALKDIQTFQSDFPEMADFILRYQWVADGITEDEQLALRHLLHIVQGGTVGRLVGAPLPESLYLSIVEAMRRHHYLMDGITTAERLFLERLLEINEQSTMLAVFIADEPDGESISATPTPPVAPTPTAKPEPTPTPPPAYTPTPVAPLPPGAESIADAIAPMGSSLMWVAYFDNYSKSWYKFDPTGAFNPEVIFPPISSDYQFGDLTHVTPGDIYLVGIGREVTYRGVEWQEGVLQVIWPAASSLSGE